MPQKIQHRWRLFAAATGCTLILVALVMFQGAGAVGQQQEPEPIPLQPPFVFQAADRQAPASSDVLPPSAVTLLTEPFGAGFVPTIGVTGTTTAWRIFTDTGSVNYYWARVPPIVSSAFGDTAWAPFGGLGGGLDPDGDLYPANMGTWLIYGPVDLRDYSAAEATYSFRLDANPSVDGSGAADFFSASASNDGTNFTGVQLTGNLFSSGWLTGTVNLQDYVGQASVYLGFYFRSNGDSNRGRGAYLDNVVLRAVPFLKQYMPDLWRNYPPVTPTPTLPPALYFYHYDSALGQNDPDFVAWGQTYTNKSGNTTIYEQGLAGSLGNPGNGMYLLNTQLNYVTMAGPNVTVSGNYEISADFSVSNGKNNARYGIIFGAGNSTFGRNGTIPTFNINTNYYKFALQFPDGPGEDPADFQLERCDGNGSSCPDLVSRTPIPSAANADGVWDNITVRRSSNSIVVLVNGVQILSVSDGTYTGSRKFGVFIQSASVNGTANPLRVRWDSYRVSQLP